MVGRWNTPVLMSLWQLTIWDERPDYADQEKIPWAKVISCPLEDLAAKAPQDGLFHQQSYVVIVTWGHLLDSEAMRMMARHEAAYIGVIGSRTKIDFVDDKVSKTSSSDDWRSGFSSRT